MAPSDAELMCRVRAGEVHLFDQLVSRHYRSVLHYFYRLCWDRHLAEDAAQEVFLRLYRARGAYEPTARFTTFLYRIAQNHWIDLCRARRSRASMGSLDAPMQGSAGRTLVEAIPGDGPEPDATVRHGDLRRRLILALDTLNPGQRQVFLLSNDQGLRYEEIAEILGIPVGTVKSRMHEAVRKLRKALAEEGEDD